MTFHAASHPRAAVWRDAIPQRHSRRSYDGSPVAPHILDALEALAAEAQAPHARVVVLHEAPQALFAGILGSYGGIAGAPSALAFVGDGSHEADAWVGYLGEALVLEATALGLDTCWVAGLFNGHVAGELARVAPGERVYAVTPLGRAKFHVTVKERALRGGGTRRHDLRLGPSVIAPGSEEWPEWAFAALPPVCIAPSAMNRQPWRFSLDGADAPAPVTAAAAAVSAAAPTQPAPNPAPTLTLAYDGGVGIRTTKRLDCGIAMLHAELGMAEAGVNGRWEVLGADAAPQVARFVRE